MQHAIVSQAEWLAARKALLAKEKEFTKARDALSAARRALPWVKVEKNYVFDGPAGKQTLADLFDGRSQLIVYHFMFGPGLEGRLPALLVIGPTTSIGASCISNQRDVSMVAVSRAPSAKLEAYRKRMGWTFKWLSSNGTDFNFDFHVSFTPEEMAANKAVYNFVEQEPHVSEREGISVFIKDASGAIFHTYSTYARGIDLLSTDYNYLDLAPKGRDEGDRGPYLGASGTTSTRLRRRPTAAAERKGGPT